VPQVQQRGMPQTVLHLSLTYSAFTRPELSLSLQQCRLSTVVVITVVVAVSIGFVFVVVVEALSVMRSTPKLSFVGPKM